ncbi:hypothetical protein QRX60_29235 [Amycolatopsis mongoliensis]|uniref:Uncharacterized protein n=1 Tax=Amycolatopsis mongoliensis TaxID=715475 RepID=A0A9Y2JI55_9PSEU|nr:hypothetical protein [Amycolatopsis sp. 4-36]WIX98149.1 hypothetical protein QRX60_29235 [Amycolatopsis sp. 4-36]
MTDLAERAIHGHQPQVRTEVVGRGDGVDQLRSEVTAELDLGQVAVEELLASLSRCLTELSPLYLLLNENGDEYDSLRPDLAES